MGLLNALLLLVLLTCSQALPAIAIKYNTTSRRDPKKLNVHLVAHTHDDSGWLKTFDEYYWGTRQYIQTAAVQHILSTVVQALGENPDRKFCYAEMSFFSKWWGLQPPVVQDQVKQLVTRGHLEFINGGFVQHDEAAAHYVAMIDQTTRGHRFLNRTFGITPKTAWQIDPFGHSATQASLLLAAAGFEALFFGRADYQDMKIRSSNKQLEILWRPSVSWGESGQIWTHNYPSGNYGPPEGFNFDYGAWDAPIVDDPTSPEYNVPARVEDFIKQVDKWSDMIQGNDILFMMGSDFQFVNAHANFINMDRLIHHVNADSRVNVFYSTPSAYVAAKASYSNISWPVKTDDFFPYADCEHCYWTGYFTSRPTSKGYIRQATAYLAAARQLQALVNLGHDSTARSDPDHSGSDLRSSDHSAPDLRSNLGRSALRQQQQDRSDHSEQQQQQQQQGFSLEALEFAVSLSQHHDAITGTEKQAVANDYARYLYLGMQQASDLVNAALLTLLKSGEPAPSAAASSSTTPATSSSNGLFIARIRYVCCRLYDYVSTRIWDPIKHLVGGGSSSSGGVKQQGIFASADLDRDPDHDPYRHLDLQLSQCPLLNVSICPVTAAATSPQRSLLLLQQSSSSSSSSNLLVVIYNSLGWRRQELVTVPVSAGSYAVQDADCNEVTSQLLPVTEATKRLQQQLAAAGLIPAAAAAAAGGGSDRAAAAAAAATGLATHELVFVADLPAVGYATYAVQALQPSSSSSSNALISAGSSRDVHRDTHYSQTAQDHPHPQPQQQQQQQRIVSNGLINITLDEVTGRFTQIAAADGSWAIQFTQEIMWYKSSNGEDSDTAAADAAGSGECGSGSSGECSSSSNGRQSSGAYIFRPAADTPDAQQINPLDQPLKITVATGPVVTQITQTWSDWASLTTRLVVRSPQIYQEWSVGPIPVADRIGKEIIVRTTTDLNTSGVLFTDSNGREMLMRKRDYRPSWTLNVTEPVSGNYYPLTSAAAVSDGCIGVGVAVDRAQGAASLTDGHLEVMVHRTTVVDDQRGVGEPLNETICGTTAATGSSCTAGGLAARGRHTYVIGPVQGLARSLRSAAQQLNDPVILAFSELGYSDLKSHGAISAHEESPEVPEKSRSSETRINKGGTRSDPRAAAKGGTVSDTVVSSSSGSDSSGIIPALGIRGRWSGLQQRKPAPSAAAAAVAGSGPDLTPAAPAAAAAESVLPSNVHLMTLMLSEEISSNSSSSKKLILRLAHTLQAGEDAELAVPARVDLSKLLDLEHNTSITNITELSLTAARYKADMKRPRSWLAGDLISHDSSAPAAAAAAGGEGAAVDDAAAAAAAAAAAVAAPDADGHRPARQLLLQQPGQQDHTMHDASSSSNAADQRMPACWGDACYRGYCHSSGRGSFLEPSQSAAAAARTYDIWDHSKDPMPVVEIYPMEIRTFEITVTNVSWL